ncbi:hypothetical protein Syun_024238 [Stephania yunnanensis]|uniref:Pentatricopeptide repeat-containing protein n=1 Tax=Stephania yunnanensis TaxID=152371 RepID=A0AAP0I402_9MAGN
MKRAKPIMASLRLLKSHHLARHSTTRSLHFQVTRLPHYPHCFSSLYANHTCCSCDSLSTHKNMHFSTRPSSLLDLIVANEWSQDLEKEVHKLCPRPTHETVMYILKKLEKTPLKALDFFNWVRDRDGFDSSSGLYGLVLRILGRKETMKEFWVVIKRMCDEGYELDKETFLTIVSVFGKEKMASDAVALTQLYNKMVQDSATDVAVKGVVDAVLGSDWNDEVEKKLGEIELSLTDNSMVKILRDLKGHPLKALGFFRWVSEHLGFKNNVITYNAIARILGREETIEKFWEMIEEMKSAGHDMDIDTYIKLSRQFQKNKMIEDAVKLYEFMLDGPYKPSVQDCSALLRKISLSTTPDLNLVFRVVKKYEATGHSLSKAVYDGIHRSLTSVGRFDEAEKILDNMKNAGYEPDNITYSQLVYGLCKARRFDEACKVMDEMETIGCVPDIKTWTILIQGHCYAGEVDEALKCFTKMLEKNCDADADLLEVLVSALCSKRRVDGAYTLLIEMVKKARLRPWQATFKDLISKLLGERKLDEALNLLRMMKKHNFPPFAEPFVEYISKSGTVDDAKEFLSALTVKQYPSSSAYAHILQSFIREGRQSEAQDLLYKCPHHIRNHSDIVKLFGSSKISSSNQKKNNSYLSKDNKSSGISFVKE